MFLTQLILQTRIQMSEAEEKRLYYTAISTLQFLLAVTGNAAVQQPAWTSGFMGASEAKRRASAQIQRGALRPRKTRLFQQLLPVPLCACFPALYLFLATEITIELHPGIHLTSCFLLVNRGIRGRG